MRAWWVLLAACGGTPTPSEPPVAPPCGDEPGVGPCGDDVVPGDFSAVPTLLDDPSDLAPVGDVTGDGRDDVVVLGDAPRLLRGRVGPSLVEGAGWDVSGPVRGAVGADVDGDGWRDLVVAVEQADGVALWLMVGPLDDARRRPTSRARFPAVDGRLVGLGDVHGTGRDEVVFASSRAGGEGLRLVLGPTGQLSLEVAGEALAGFRGIGDVDRDGCDDTLAFAADGSLEVRGGCHPGSGRRLGPAGGVAPWDDGGGGSMVPVRLTGGEEAWGVVDLGGVDTGLAEPVGLDERWAVPPVRPQPAGDTPGARAFAAANRPTSAAVVDVGPTHELWLGAPDAGAPPDVCGPGPDGAAADGPTTGRGAVLSLAAGGAMTPRLAGARPGDRVGTVLTLGDLDGDGRDEVGVRGERWARDDTGLLRPAGRWVVAPRCL